MNRWALRALLEVVTVGACFSYIALLGIVRWPVVFWVVVGCAVAFFSAEWLMNKKNP